MGFKSVLNRLRKPSAKPQVHESAPAGALGESVTWDAWEGTLEKELSDVVQPLPADQLGQGLECSVCLRVMVARATTWVVFPCKHGVCSQCFQSILDAQSRQCFCPMCRDPILRSPEAPEAPVSDAATVPTGEVVASSPDTSDQQEVHPLPASRVASPTEGVPDTGASADESLTTNEPHNRVAWWLTGKARQRASKSQAVAYVSASAGEGRGVWATVGDMVLWLPNVQAADGQQLAVWPRLDPPDPIQSALGYMRPTLRGNQAWFPM